MRSQLCARQAAKHNRGAQRKLVWWGLELKKKKRKRKIERESFGKGLAEKTRICKSKRTLSAILALILLWKRDMFSVNMVPAFVTIFS